MKKLILLMVGVLFLGFATSCKKSKTENPTPIVAPTSRNLIAIFNTSNLADSSYVACICINGVNYQNHIQATTVIFPVNVNDSVDVQIVSGITYFNTDSVTVKLIDGTITKNSSNRGDTSSVAATINYFVN